MKMNKPTILIYVVDPNLEILKETCAGIEEEGVLYEIVYHQEKDLDTLSFQGANDSILGSGIGICGLSIALQLDKLSKGDNVFQLKNPTHKQSRMIGANAARAVKRMSFKEIL